MGKRVLLYACIRYTIYVWWLMADTKERGDPAKVYSIIIITPSGNYVRIYKLEQRAYGEFYTHLPIYSFHSLLIPHTYILRPKVLDSDTPTQKSIHHQFTLNRVQIPKHIPRLSGSFANQEIDTSTRPVFAYLTEKSLIIALARFLTAPVQAQLSTPYDSEARPSTIEQSLYYQRN
jgi:hypothetical protein